MAQLSNNGPVTIDAGQSLTFTNVFVAPSELGIMLPNADNNGLYLRGLPARRLFRCMRDFFSEYYASFSANVEIPTGGTVESVSVAISVDGNPIPTSTMIATPAAVEEYSNISTQVFVPIPIYSTGLVTITNTSTQAITLQNANLTIFMANNR